MKAPSKRDGDYLLAFVLHKKGVPQPAIIFPTNYSLRRSKPCDSVYMVVDAIQFVLTGDVARLRGAGTGDLTLAEHAPHVEKRSDAEAARVVLNVYIPHLKKSPSITRTVKKPKHPQITPDDPDIREVFAYMAEHPETTLSRREIIKFILTERRRDHAMSKRS